MQEITSKENIPIHNTFQEHNEFKYENVHVENTLSPFFESFQLKRNDHGSYIIIIDYKLLLKIKKKLFKIIAFLLNKENGKSSRISQVQNVLNTSDIITNTRKKNELNDVEEQTNSHTTYIQIDKKNYEQVMQNGVEKERKNLAGQEKNAFNKNILIEKYQNIIHEIVDNDKINTFEIENVRIVVTRIKKKDQKVDKLEDFIEIFKSIPISSQSEIFVFSNKCMIDILHALHNHFKATKIYAFPLSIRSAITITQEISRIPNNPISIYVSICLLSPANEKECTFGLTEALRLGILNDKKLYIKIKENDLNYFQNRLKYIICKCIQNREDIIKKWSSSVNYMNILHFGNVVGSAIKSVFSQIPSCENYKNGYNIYGIYYELKILHEIHKISMLLFLDIEQVMAKYKLNYRLNQNFLNYYTKDIITFLHKTYCSKGNNEIPIVHLADINKIKPDVIIKVPLSIFCKVLSPIVSISTCSNLISLNMFRSSPKMKMTNGKSLNFLFIKNVGNKSETIRVIYTSCMSTQSVILKNVNLCFDVALFIKILKDLKFDICLKKKTKETYKSIFDKIDKDHIATYKCKQNEYHLSITGNIDNRNTMFLFKNFIFQDKIIFNVYNSGTVCRLILPLLCLYICKQNLKAKKENKKLLKFIVLKGNKQMESVRIISPLVKVIQKSFKYIKIIYLKKENYLPIQISVKTEKLKSYNIFLSNNMFIDNSASSQFVSSMLLISPFSETSTSIHLLYKKVRKQGCKKGCNIYRNEFFKMRTNKINYCNSLDNVFKKNIYRKGLNPKELSYYKCSYNKAFLEIVHPKKDKKFGETKMCANGEVQNGSLRSRIRMQKSNNFLKRLNKTYFETTSKAFIDLTVNVMKLWGVKVYIQNCNYIIKKEKVSKNFSYFSYCLAKKKAEKKAVLYHKKGYWKNMCRYTYFRCAKLSRPRWSGSKSVVKRVRYYKMGIRYEQNKREKDKTVLGSSQLNGNNIACKHAYRICNDLGLYFYFIVGCIIKKINCSFVLNLSLNNVKMKRVSPKYYKIKYVMIQKNVQNYFLLNLLLLLDVGIYIKRESSEQVRLFLITSKGGHMKIERKLDKFFEKRKREMGKAGSTREPNNKIKYHVFEKIHINYYFNDINKLLTKVVIDAEYFSDDFFPICVLFCYYLIIHKSENILFKIKNIHNQDIKESIRINNVVCILKMCFQNLVFISCDSNSIYITRIRNCIDNCIFSINNNNHNNSHNNSHNNNHLDCPKMNYKKSAMFYNNSKYVMSCNNILYLFIDTKNDHRVIFMTTILSLIFRNILIDNCFQIKKSYPEFYEHVREYLQINLNYCTSFELKFNYFSHMNNYNISNEMTVPLFSDPSQDQTKEHSTDLVKKKKKKKKWKPNFMNYYEVCNDSEGELPQNENYMKKYKYEDITKNDVNIYYLIKEINRLNVNIICGIRNVGKTYLGNKIKNSFVIDIDDYVFENEIKFDKIKIRDFRYYEYLTFVSVLYMSYCILAHNPCSKTYTTKANQDRDKDKIWHVDKCKQMHKTDNLFFFINNDVTFYNKKINDLYKDIKCRINKSNNNYINNITIILGGGIIEFEKSRHVISKLKNVILIKRDEKELYEICINDKIKPKLSGNLHEIIKNRTKIFNELNIPFHFSIPTENFINKNIKNLNEIRNNLIVTSFLNFFNYKFYAKPIINPKFLLTQVLSINLEDFHLFNYKTMESDHEFVELVIEGESENRSSSNKTRNEISAGNYDYSLREMNANFPFIDFELLDLAIFIIRSYTSKPIIIKLCKNMTKSGKIYLNYIISVFYKYKINLFDIDIDPDTDVSCVNVLEETNENCFFIISKTISEMNELQKCINLVNLFYVDYLKLSFHLFSKQNKELLDTILNKHYKDKLKNKSLQNHKQYINKNGKHILLYNVEPKYDPFSAFLYNQIITLNCEKEKHNKSQLLYHNFMYTYHYTNCIVAICYAEDDL
ncbi:pentafunctional AROM polypeptide, putative [Plasmodium chabaudi chabaudi]|uniref:Pentafunctional AROM polypeptide, putative n=1 Tax=Plasmodium chabaudi chabaudi TaxID=31271 RepID=A0A1D3LBB8_PLACU|nr:pentafunctional AROM polypeptide, putative [Plasmodium chabaudi chabaudi]